MKGIAVTRTATFTIAGVPIVGDGRQPTSPVNKTYPPGSYTFTATVAGRYKFVLFGGGAGAINASSTCGASGALVIATRYLDIGQSVSLVSGAAGASAGNGANSTATFPNGEVLTAQGGQGGTGGTATGNAALGDTLTNGTNGATGAGAGTPGANAPSTTDYLGGSGLANLPGTSPGAGGGVDAGTGQRGAGGSILIVQTELRL